MTEDVQDNVQPAEVSQEGTPAKEVVTEPTTGKTSEVPQTQPLTSEAITKMIEDAVAPVKESTARSIQSVKDKAQAEIDKANRRAVIAETTLNKFRGKLTETNPDFATDLELTELRTRDQHRQQSELDEQNRLRYEQTIQTFESNLNQYVTDLGIDPNDKRLDWGKHDEQNLIERQSKFLASVVKIQKAEAGKALEAVNKQIKDVETRIRKELGIDSVDTSTPASSTSDDQYLDDYGKGKVHDHKKAKEILSKKLKGG